MGLCAVLLDAGYIENVMLKEYNATKIDFFRLAQKMSAPDRLLRASYYTCMPLLTPQATDEEQMLYDRKDRFLEALDYLPNFEIRLGRLAQQGFSPNGRPIHVQKQVDMMMGVDMTMLACKRQVSSISIFSGDGDCVPAVLAAKNEGVLVRLWHGSRAPQSPNPPSRELYRVCDERYEIGPILSEIRLSHAG